MPLLHRIALATAFASCVGFAPLFETAQASAAPPYDPAVQGVDRICDGYLAWPSAVDLVTLARVPASDGSVPIWRRSDPAARARAEAAAGFPGGDFATAIFDHGSIVFAETVQIEPQSSGKQTRAWCFIGGKLSRTFIEISDADTGSGWRRWSYYGDDLTRPLSERIVPTALRGEPDMRAKPPRDRLIVDPFATPLKLPFYEPAVAAHAAARHRST